MQEFLEPTEEKIPLPTLQTEEAQEEANCDALIAEIEDVSKSAALVWLGSIGATVGVIIAMFLLLEVMPNGGLVWY